MLNFVASRSLLRGAGTLIAAGATLALLSAPSRAQVLLTFAAPTDKNVAPGGSVTFAGTLFNNTGAAIFLGATSVGLEGDPTAVMLDSSPFDSIAPASLAAGASLTGNFVTATAASDAPNGRYEGTLNVLYGPDANSTFDNNISATFGVVVTPAPAALPVFAVGGVLGLIATRRKKKNAEAE